MAEPTPDAPVADERPVVLELADVQAGYRQFKALFGVSFKLHEAQALALIGPNGAGKTTVARVASGLVAPTAGSVRVNGEDFTGRPPHDFANAGIAHVPEGRSVFATLNVEENLTLPFRHRFGRTGVPDALEKAYTLFPRLGERRTQNAGSLSGGEQRMLTLAGVLVLEPRLLIADELSLGLAPIITNEIYEVLQRILGSGTAPLIVEQHVDKALAIADEVVVLERGLVLQQGRPSRADILASVFGTTDVDVAEGVDGMSDMPVAVYRGHGTMEVEHRPVPEPGPGQVMVEVSHCGICGSDIHMMLEDWGPPDIVGGHEFAGVIAAVGSDVAASAAGWAVGDEIVCGASPKCGRCRRCLEGQPSQCENRAGAITDEHDGAFARYVLVDARSLLRVPPGLSMRDAALAEPLAVALHGITRSGVAVGDSAMVIGAGPIGALSIAALVARGIERIVVVEPGPARQQLATDLGASKVLHPDELQVFPMWEPEQIATEPMDVVLECSGKKAAMEAGFNQLRRGGRLVLVGAGIEAPSFDPNRMTLNELTVTGSFIYDADGFEQAIELLASGALPTGLLIDPVDVTLDLVGDAMKQLAQGRIAGKAMVVPRLSTDPPAPEDQR